MQDKTKAISNKLIFSGIILILILLMQPLELFFLFNDITVLFPKGLIALKERNLLLFIQAVMLVFVLPVYVLTFFFSWWYRADNEKSKYDPHLVDNKIAEVIWWGLPLVLTAIVAYITYLSTYELDPYKPLASEAKPLKIEVVALQWRWLFLYPEQKIASLNHLQIPKDRPVQFEITADAPMNSFWIPRLGGQIYAMPGMRTTLHLIANEEGRFRGSSANISGEGFADMYFYTYSTSEEEFEKWVASVKGSEKELNLDAYRLLSKPSTDRETQFFRLGQDNLFHQILMKFMSPDSPLRINPKA